MALDGVDKGQSGRPNPALRGPAVGGCSFQGERLRRYQRTVGGGHRRFGPLRQREHGGPFARQRPRCPSGPAALPAATNRAGASERENRAFEAAPAAPQPPAASGRRRQRGGAGSRRDTGAAGDARRGGRGAGGSPGALGGVSGGTHAGSRMVPRRSQGLGGLEGVWGSVGARGGERTQLGP